MQCESVSSLHLKGKCCPKEKKRELRQGGEITFREKTEDIGVFSHHKVEHPVNSENRFGEEESVDTED